MTNDTLRRLRNLRKAEQRIVPDAAWVRATRATLLMQVRNTLPRENSLSLWSRTRATFQTFAPRTMGSWLHRPLIAMMSLVAMLTGGSIMSVSAAEQALPGDFLYNLKLATEQARLAFTPVKSEKLQLKTEFTTRRVDELKQVAEDSEHPDRVVQVAEILKRDLNTLKQQLNDMGESTPEDQTAAARLVDQKSGEVILALQDTKSQLSPESIEKVTDAQSAAADTGMKAIELLVVQHQQSNELVPAEDVTQAIQGHVKAVSGATSSTLILIPLEAVLPNATGTLTLAQIVASPKISASTSSLPLLIEQVKGATTQAFVQQKAIDQLSIADASSTQLTATPVSPSAAATGTIILTVQNPTSTTVTATTTKPTTNTKD